MILDGSDAPAGRTTLDDLFRRAGVRRPDAPALADPPNRETVTGGAPRALTYAQADRAISAMAARLRALGLAADTVVALQLPNTVDGIVALLGVLRAGMIAAPLPLLWRQREIVEALGRAGARAIVTCGRAGGERLADVAMQAAAALFPIRHVCAFGGQLPDGVAPLDDIFAPSPSPAMQPYVRTGNPAAHTAVMTFDSGSDGIEPAPRHHAQLIAAGRAVTAASALRDGARILSPIPPSSFAGIAVTLLPWLLSGGTLSLHHAFDASAFAAQSRAQDAAIVPGPMLGPLAQAGHLAGPQDVIALWRSPPPAEPAWQGTARLADVTSLSQSALHAAARDESGRPASQARHDNTGPGVVAIGGYRFRQSEIDAQVAAIDAGAMIVALPDALLGQRLAGSAARGEAVRAELQTRGVNPLIAGAFRPRARPDAA